MAERLTAKDWENPMSLMWIKLGLIPMQNEVYRISLSKALCKLARYEDLEEQNRLIELPCKIGDTVYVIPSKVNYELNIVNHHEENNRVYEQTVHSIQMFSNYRYVLATCDGLCSILSDFYKETWFLTREEAEAALKGNSNEEIDR